MPNNIMLFCRMPKKPMTFYCMSFYRYAKRQNPRYRKDPSVLKSTAGKYIRGKIVVDFINIDMIVKTSFMQPKKYSLKNFPICCFPCLFFFIA